MHESNQKIKSPAIFKSTEILPVDQPDGLPNDRPDDLPEDRPDNRPDDQPDDGPVDQPNDRPDDLPDVSDCPQDMIVPIPQGQSWHEASWTEPEGVELKHKSHSRPSQWIQVGGSFEVRYDYEDSDGNIVECVFTVTGVGGSYYCQVCDVLLCFYLRY